MRRFDLYFLKVLVLQNNVTAALVFETFDDLVGWNFFRVSLRHLFVPNWTKIAGAKLSEAKLFLARGWIDCHRNVHQSEANTPFPDGSHMGLFSHSSAGVSTLSVAGPTPCVYILLTTELPCNLCKQSDLGGTI